MSVTLRVAAGAEWLDVRWPGWAHEVDLLKLDMSSGCRCILGQTFGDYHLAPLADRDADTLGNYAFDVAAAELGFQAGEIAESLTARRLLDTAVRDAEYVALHAEWTRLILARRPAVTP